MSISEAELRQIVAEVLARMGAGAPASGAAAPAAPAAAPAEAGLPDVTDYDLRDRVFLTGAGDPDGLAALKRTSPARIGIGRAGPRYRTEPWLRFRADHAAARDAVLMEVDESLMEQLGLFKVQTQVRDKDEYLTRPDLGRRLSDEAKETLRRRCAMGPQVQVVVVDGLSSAAIAAQAPRFLPALMRGLETYGLKPGTPFYVKYGRVAVMDEIGELFQPDLLIEAVGERPGLVTAESMSAYMCWRPRLGTVEADRMLISNIHDGGMPAVEAGAAAAALLQKMFDNQASGTRLAAM